MEVLKAHQEAQRELQLAAEMRKEAETGWLPLWAQRRWRSSQAAAAASVAALRRSLYDAWSAAGARVAAGAAACRQAAASVVHGKLQPAVASARQAVAQTAGRVWALKLQPVLRKWVRNWPEIEEGLARSWSVAGQRLGEAAAQARGRIAAAKAAADAAVLRQLQRVPSLGPLASHTVASSLVWGAIAAATLPVALALVFVALQYAVFRLRPGSVRVQPPGSGGAWNRLEEALGYCWEQHATLKAALGGGSSDSAEVDAGSSTGAAAAAAASGRFAWLGAALMQLLAAEAAFKQQPAAAGADALEQAAGALAGPAAVAAKAEAATLPRLVLAGTGAQSRQLAASKAAELYIACLGAAYVDSGFELEAPRKVFRGPATAKPSAATPAAKSAAATPAAAANGTSASASQE
jgi:hypothetical protein